MSKVIEQSLRSTTVRFERGDAAFAQVLRDTAGVPGIYVFAVNGTVLRVGESADLGYRLAHHLATGYGQFRAEYPHYFDFFEPIIGCDILLSWSRLDGGKVARCEVERSVIARQPVVWERLMKARKRGKMPDFRRAALEVLGACAPSTGFVERVVPAATPAGADLTTRTSGSEVRGSGGLSREAQRKVLNAFPELEEYPISNDRLNWRVRGGRAIAREFAANGKGYVFTRDIPGIEYVVDDRGWTNVREFSPDELRRVVEQALKHTRT